MQNIAEYAGDKEVLDYIKENKIKGWVGTVEVPQQLKSSDDNFSNIIVYINGKIADEDILESRPNSRIVNNYIVGEFQADFFSQLLDDPITSSRQGLDDADENVRLFINYVFKIRNFVINKWNSIRVETAVEKLPDRIKNNASYKEWLDTLKPEQKNINNRLVDMLSPELPEDTNESNSLEVEQLVTSICSTVNNIDITKITNALDSTSTDNQSYLPLITELMNNVGIQEEIKQSEIAHSRIGAIDKLKDLMEQPNAAEKLFQQHLAKNPWLINPTWTSNKSISDDYLKILREKYYSLIDSNDEFHRNFIDIYVTVSEEPYPIIIELKKNTPKDHAKVDFYSIIKQIAKYRAAIKQNNTDFSKIKDTEIKAIFILSEDSGLVGENNTIQLAESEKQMLDAANIELHKYSELLEHAYQAYAEQIALFKNKKIIPNLS